MKKVQYFIVLSGIVLLAFCGIQSKIENDSWKYIEKQTKSNSYSIGYKVWRIATVRNDKSILNIVDSGFFYHKDNYSFAGSERCRYWCNDSTYLIEFKSAKMGTLVYTNYKLSDSLLPIIWPRLYDPAYDFSLLFDYMKQHGLYKLKENSMTIDHDSSFCRNTGYCKLSIAAHDNKCYSVTLKRDAEKNHLNCCDSISLCFIDNQPIKQERIDSILFNDSFIRRRIIYQNTFSLKSFFNSQH